MSRLDELLKQQNYTEIIKLYAHSNDIEEMFSYALSLAILNQTKEANEYFIKHNDVLISQPVRLINSHVNTYLYVNDFLNAKKVVEYYEDKPYISQEVEECFINVKNKIIEAEKRSLKTSEIDVATIRKYLSSKNDSLIQKAIMKMRDYKINTFINELRDILIDSSLKASTRMLTIMLLKIENYNGVLDFFYFIKNKIINIDLNKIELINYQTYSLRFNDLISSINNSSIQDTFLSYLQTFDMMFFPLKCPYKDEAIFYAILLYCYELYGQDKEEINNKIKSSNIKKEEIEEITSLLNNQIKEFLQ